MLEHKVQPGKWTDQFLFILLCLLLSCPLYWLMLVPPQSALTPSHSLHLIRPLKIPWWVTHCHKMPDGKFYSHKILFPLHLRTGPILLYPITPFSLQGILGRHFLVLTHLSGFATRPRGWSLPIDALLMFFSILGLLWTLRVSGFSQGLC